MDKVETIKVEDIAGIAYKLTPLVMAAAGEECIYMPSRLRKSKQLSWLEFTANYTDAQALVSFEADGVSNPELMTVYGAGLDCWYLVEFEVTK